MLSAGPACLCYAYALGRKSETAVHCCDPALAVLVMLVSLQSID